MGKTQPDFHFKGMAFLFKLRDFFVPRKKILEEVGIEAGFSVLDFGCGPGGYIAGLSERVTESGRVFALDRHPLAIQSVKKIVSKKILDNVLTIQSDGSTGLPDSSLEVVLLYDILHELGEKEKVLKELHRVLKGTGTLSVSDHHLQADEIIALITGSDLFRLSRRGKKTVSFEKVVQDS